MAKYRSRNWGYFIYKITNNANNKIYIGKTEKTIKLRFGEHIRGAFNTKYKLYNSPLSRAIRKYGISNFSVEELDRSTFKEELNFLERYYIQLYKARNNSFGYNVAQGGEGGDLGFANWQKNNPEAESNRVKKILETRSKWTDEQRKENNYKTTKGLRNLSKDDRAKIAEKRRGRHLYTNGIKFKYFYDNAILEGFYRCNSKGEKI